MHRASVKSSVIATIGYDDQHRVLEVTFHSGRVYGYYDVPPEIVRDFLTARSIGKYFNEVIRPRFRMEKMEEDGRGKGGKGGRKRKR